MNRTIPLILILVLLTLGVGFFIVGQQRETPLWTMITKKESPPQETYAEKIEREKSETEEGMRLYALARDEKDMTYCDAIRLPSLRTSCADMVLSTRAQDEKKSELCEVITDTGAESRCRDNILFFLATEIQDIASCGRIGDEHIRANCVEALEEKTYDARVLSGSLDRPFCDSLMTDSLRANCEGQIARVVDTRVYRDATVTSDHDRCDTITDVGLASQCRDAITLEKAAKSGDLELCDVITDHDRMSACRDRLLSRSDITKYQEIVRKGDILACETLTAIQMRTQCHDTILFSKVRMTRDPDLCDRLYNTGVIERCRTSLQ